LDAQTLDDRKLKVVAQIEDQTKSLRDSREEWSNKLDTVQVRIAVPLIQEYY